MKRIIDNSCAGYLWRESFKILLNKGYTPAIARAIIKNSGYTTMIKRSRRKEQWMFLHSISVSEYVENMIRFWNEECLLCA